MPLNAEGKIEREDKSHDSGTGHNRNGDYGSLSMATSCDLEEGLSHQGGFG